MPGSLLKCLIFITAAIFIVSGCKKDKIKCGDGVKEGDELCDGTDFGGDNCQNHGYLGGLLHCNESCDAVLFTGCSGGCGNGMRDEGEECDSFDFGGDNCELHDFDYGDLLCNSDCTVDYSGCLNAVCGNGEIEPVEECEPDIAIERTCEDFGFNAGDVTCDAPGSETECHLNTSACVTWECGNGEIDPGENCDFDSDGNELLGGETCESQGYDFGDLACNPPESEDGLPCRFDTSGCSEFECGNGSVEEGEDCEPTVEITDTTCADQGFESGDLGCLDDGTCRFDFSACVNGCGNGVIELEEECDGEDVGGQDCASVSSGTLTGELRCKTDCTFDLTLCEAA